MHKEEKWMFLRSRIQKLHSDVQHGRVPRTAQIIAGILGQLAHTIAERIFMDVDLLCGLLHIAVPAKI